MQNLIDDQAFVSARHYVLPFVKEKFNPKADWHGLHQRFHVVAKAYWVREYGLLVEYTDEIKSDHYKNHGVTPVYEKNRRTYIEDYTLPKPWAVSLVGQYDASLSGDLYVKLTNVQRQLIAAQNAQMLRIETQIEDDNNAAMCVIAPHLTDRTGNPGNTSVARYYGDAKNALDAVYALEYDRADQEARTRKIGVMQAPLELFMRPHTERSVREIRDAFYAGDWRNSEVTKLMLEMLPQDFSVYMNGYELGGLLENAHRLVDGGVDNDRY